MANCHNQAMATGTAAVRPQWETLEVSESSINWPCFVWESDGFGVPKVGKRHGHGIWLKMIWPSE